ARMRLATALAAIAGLVGALTLSEHVLGWNLGIDQLLVAEAPGAPATTSPGRMGPNAAMSLAFASLALLSLRRRTPAAGLRAMICALVVAMFAIAAITGYLYSVEELYSIARFTGIALHTSIAFLLTSVGILVAVRDISPISILSSPGPGGLLA